MNLWSYAWSNLKRRKLRTLLTILSIVIGVGATFGVIASVDTAQKAFPLYLKEAFNKADITISGTDAYFPETVLDELRQIPNAKSVAVLKQSAQLHLEQEGISSIQKRVDLSGYSELDTPITAFKVIEGDLAAKGAIITDRTAAAWNISAGDTLAFNTDYGRKEIAVAAVVKYTTELMGPSSWMMAKYHPWSVAVPLDDLQEWFGLSGKIQTVQIKSEAPEHLADVQRQAEAVARQYGNIYVQPVVIDFESASRELNVFYMSLYIAGFLGIILSAFVIFNSMYVSVQERKNEFAVLKTIGYTPGQLQVLVYAEVILLAAIGTVAGLVAGTGLAWLMKTLIFLLAGMQDDGSLLMGKGLLVSVIAGLLIPAAASLYPIREVGKMSVIQTLSGRGSASKGTRSRMIMEIIGVLLIIASFFVKHMLLIVPLLIGTAMVYPWLFRGFVAALKPIYGSLLGMSGKVAASNLGRNLGRSSMTSVVLCLGISMIVMMSSLNSALIQSYERVIFASYGGNLDVMLHHVEDTDLETLRQIPGVKDAETYRKHEAVWTIGDVQRKLPVYGVKAARIDQFPMYTSPGKAPSELLRQLNANEVIMSKVTYDMWGGEVGESIVLDTLDGKQTYKVAAVVESMKNGGYGIFMEEEHFIQSFGPKYERNALVLKTDDMSPLELRERIFDQFGSRIMEMFGPEDWVTVIGGTYTGSFAIINLLIILSVVISGIGITNTLLMNIMERVRELGMMRAVGVTRSQVVRMVVLEGFGIGLAATIIGCLLGILIIYLVTDFLEIHSLTFEFGVPGNVMMIILIFGLVVSLVSSFSPAAKAAKTRLSEALRYE